MKRTDSQQKAAAKTSVYGKLTDKKVNPNPENRILPVQV
jgi:hypothetical protein